MILHLMCIFIHTVNVSFQFVFFSCLWELQQDSINPLCPDVQDTCLNVPNYVGCILFSIKSCLGYYPSGEEYVLGNFCNYSSWLDLEIF